MARWIILLLLFLVIAAGIHYEPPGIEQRLHGKVVLALSDEDLSEIRVQMDGRNVSLSGPENLLGEALTIIENLPGVGKVDSRNIAGSRTDDRLQENSAHRFVQVIHPDALFWPAKKENLEPVILDVAEESSRIQPIESHSKTNSNDNDGKQMEESREPSIIQVIHPDETYWPVKMVDLVPSELLVKKMKQNLKVNGSVPSQLIKRGILTKIQQFIDIPEDLFDVTVNKLRIPPDWYSEDLPLIIPFIQWVDEGQLEYYGNRILLDGIVLNKNARNAIETAIANLSPQFQIENRLKLRTK